MNVENLWAPWRMQYIRQLEANEQVDTDQQPRCFLCEAQDHEVASQPAQQRLIIDRTENCLLMLNRFPYTSGHLLVSPLQHVGDLMDLDASSRAALIETVALAEQTLKKAYNPQGINIGMNIGRCAGAGLPGHLHVHLVPRWGGDTNFMSTVGSVRIMPEALEESYQRLCKAYDSVRQAQ